jgi:hypothetical protein
MELLYQGVLLAIVFVVLLAVSWLLTEGGWGFWLFWGGGLLAAVISHRRPPSG